MTLCCALSGDSLPAPPGELTAADYAASVWANVREYAKPERYIHLLIGFGTGAAAWPEAVRRAFCRSVPAIELAPGVAPFGAMISMSFLTIVSAPLRRCLEAAGCNVAFSDIAGGTVTRGEWFGLWVQHFADPVDHDRTPGSLYSVDLPDGTTGAVWQPDPPSDLSQWPPVPIHYCADFVAPSPMFRSIYPGVLGGIMVTDDLAERLLRSGLPGLTLQDVWTERGQRERVLKSR